MSTLAPFPEAIAAGRKTPIGAWAEEHLLHRFTVEQYLEMISAGILPEDSSTELLDGVVVRKDTGTFGEAFVGHNPPHALVITLLSLLIVRINGPRRHLRIQLPVVVDEFGSPEPDGSIVRGTPRDYSDRLPQANDLYCVIEVAHSSLERDEGEKLLQYARASIAQYIVINLRIGIIEVYSDPDRVRGEYQTKLVVLRGGTVDINLGDGEAMVVAAAELLP